MNPSSAGWIKKLLKEIGANSRFLKYDEELFYDSLRACGFIYGSNLDVVNQVIHKKDLTEEELCKTNLCLALYYTYYNSHCKTSFVESVNSFYASINDIKTSFFKDLLGEKKSSEQLEKIIHKRIQIDANLLTKNFNYFIINALLFVDVLAYKAYLQNLKISTDYLKNMEASITSISLDVLNSKETKNQYDESLIKLFESSLRYQENSHLNYKKSIKNVKTQLEKYYILDLACMATWSDQMIDVEEQHFLEKLGQDLNLSFSKTQQSIKAVNLFYTVNKDNIALLSSKNVVQSFYNNSSKMVNKLITRNSKRLYQELKDSKELMVLISQSTVRDLNKEEQKKVQDQLLDIFKSIPSLAIFLLPGGALLLPLVVKFIPKLLPSAFDENRIEE
ncbi:MAG: LETM1-related biofilm-associated protein [Algibacter sp.]|uniref:LETM1-related biofilm-associated protein n=1 Tax=Algibacter sp. TaxID=1872428 RepID=UPI00260D50E7|nr:LETM1-related biofilm-associated protein [Algibacter sp.]MDG1728810.1 LETM1-related biofilm-associated protein [Algibacter sp.]MDG2177283.1 LETM1-related biofilm-associated protein [Algibacter sp.]